MAENNYNEINFDRVEIIDCIELYERKNIITVINNGIIVEFNKDRG